MGLDSSIYRKQELSNNHDEITKCIEKGKPEPRYEAVYKETEVLYLRKANQIHKYFVDKFADGKDNQEEICLDLEDIKKLRSICKKVIKSITLVQDGEMEVYDLDDLEDGNFAKKTVPRMIIKDLSLAKKLLPTSSGFFFGSTDYDDMYLEDLESYVSQADELIKEHKELIQSGVKSWDISYYYQASW